MDSGSIFQIIILIILLLLSAFFSSAETALTTVNRIRMRSLAEDGNSRAACVLKVTDDSGKMLSAILIGNNIVNLSASSIATSLALDMWGSVGAGIATGILTLLILIFGEISPKTIATINEEHSSLDTCYFRAGKLGYLSSSMVMELYTYGKSVQKYVPKPVLEVLEKKKERR